MELTIRDRVTRDLQPVLEQLINEEPAIIVEGPRGSGKSTLVREAGLARGALIVNLDDEATLALVLQDPTSAITSPGLVIIDEFQRAPTVLSVVKRIVDESGDPGRFLLAGSVSAALLPTGAETLTGRVHRLLLAPLSTAELIGGPGRLLPSFLDTGEVLLSPSKLSRPDYFDCIVAGGYPAALRRQTSNLRRRWFASYLGSVAERDLPQVVDIRHPGALARLYRLVARQTSTTIGRSVLGEELGLSASTARAYLDLLMHVHLVTELPGWTVGVSAKEGRRPKIHVSDTGLGSSAIGMDAKHLASGALAGYFMESYVLAELKKQAAIVDEPLVFAHFRDRAGTEVDIVIERPDGRVLAIEVKSATSVNAADARGLRFLQDRLGDRFMGGIIFHTGPLGIKMGEKIWALPVSSLWAESYSGTSRETVPSSA